MLLLYTDINRHVGTPTQTEKTLPPGMSLEILYIILSTRYGLRVLDYSDMVIEFLDVYNIYELRIPDYSKLIIGKIGATHLEHLLR